MQVVFPSSAARLTVFVFVFVSVCFLTFLFAFAFFVAALCANFAVPMVQLQADWVVCNGFLHFAFCTLFFCTLFRAFAQPLDVGKFNSR